MSKMTICLWFDRGKAREAAEFYASVFPDSQPMSPRDTTAARNWGSSGVRIRGAIG